MDLQILLLFSDQRAFWAFLYLCKQLFDQKLDVFMTALLYYCPFICYSWKKIQLFLGEDGLGKFISAAGELEEG